MSVHTTNDANAFIAVAEDCPVDVGTAPPERTPAARAAFFSRGQPCLRSSPLAKSYGWGFHCDDQGRVALVAAGTARCDELVADGSLAQRRAMRRSRARAPR